MPLKKSTGNMYDFITHTWNPVKGKCPYDCSYCYVGRWGTQPELHLDVKELRTDLGHDNFIFVCSGCDLFHPKVQTQWVLDVLDYTKNFGNKYLFHTKNPARVIDIFGRVNFPFNSILCATIESNIPWPGISKAPQPFERAEYLRKWKGEKMITIEPVMDFDVMTFWEMIVSCEPSQVNIGADSGHNRLPEPPREKLEELVELLAPHTRIHLKKNLRWLLPESRYYEAL